MRGRDQTSMGGARETFLTTHWSLIEDIQAGQDKDRALIGLLLNRYWKPVYCYLRQKGHDNEQAKDLTQGFFQEIVLNRNLVQRADQAKGRFRSFLLHALNQYLIDEKRKQAAQKRIPKGKLVPLDVVEPPVLPQTVTELAPEDCFNYAWKSALLDRTLSEVEGECIKEGMQTHWKVFRDRVVQPTLKNLEPPSLKQICAKHGIEDEVKASNMIITVKRRFQTVLKKSVRNTVVSEEQIGEELKEMLKFFREKAQDSQNSSDL
jgi:DNA-directed RNA polymerase specialized sigma24 family protein